MFYRILLTQKFRQDYDKLLRESIQKSERLAVKYCGKEALPVAEVSHVQKDAEKPASEEKLFTSSQKKEEQVLPEKDIDECLNDPYGHAYEMIDDNGNILGGTIVNINPDTNINHLDFLFVKVRVQSNGIGRPNVGKK